MPSTHRWVVDTIEESAAAVEVDGNTIITLPIWILPAAAREGDVLRVSHERPPKGQRSALMIEVDPTATKQSLADSADQVAKAKARTKQIDPGGDITL